MLATIRPLAAEAADPDGGHFLAGVYRPIDDFVLRCPRDLLVDVAAEKACTVLETSVLGTIGTSTFGSAKYGRDGADGEAINDVLVYEISGDGRARPFWYDSSEIAYEYIDKVDVVDVPNGPLFDVSYCMNGTGGCSQKTFIRRGSEWKALVRDKSWDAVYTAVPKPYVPHKSPPIDFRTLHWEENLSAPSDPNCCSSASIEFRLGIVGDSLSVKSYRFVMPPSPAVSPADRAPPDTSVR